MQNSLCPLCHNIRASSTHLQTHNLNLPHINNICEDFTKRGIAMRSAPKSKRKSTMEILKDFEIEMGNHCTYLSQFLSLSKTICL